MVSKSTKVLILTNYLMEYRIPILNLLAKDCDLTVAFCECEVPKECEFKTIILKTPIFFGQFIINRENIHKLCSKFDAVICMGNIKWLKYSIQAFLPRKFKLAFWSIGVSASYSKGFDKVTKWDWVRDLFYKAADANVFYTDYPIKKNLIQGYKAESMFVANNTVEVLDIEKPVKKRSLLFIGSLYREKGLQILLDAYKQAIEINKNIPKLNIVGEGTEFYSIKLWIKENDLQNKILLHGSIYDKKIKRDFFSQALACISPKQAGLSVLESMGYGVPFITRDNAISGGEIFNIDDGETGILVKNDSDFLDIILDIANHPEKYEAMGKAAKDYYQAQRTPEIMKEGLLRTVEYMLR